MTQSNPKQSSSGFAVVESVLIIVIIAAIAGAGIYVMHKNSAKQNTNKSALISAPAANGTTASVNKLTQQDEQTEAGVDASSDSQAQQASTSSNGVVNNVGGAYNENNL